MGRERSGTRQYFYFCAAGLIIAVVAACAPLKTMLAEQESRPYLQRAQHLLSQGDFAGALRENQQVLALSPAKPPGDAALFNLGLLHVHAANPARDYKKAQGFFRRLEKEFPKSPRTEEAKVWGGLLQAMEMKAEQESRAHLQREQLERVQHLISQGDFEGALRENQKTLSLSPKNPPGDAALFNMGLIHVHYANPKKDIGKGLEFFRQFEKEFPGSPRTEEARIWAGVLKTMEKTKQIDFDIEAKKKVLRR